MVKLRQSKYIALLLATGVLVVNFWAWSLLSPLATTYAKEFDISPFALSALVAAPVLVGSLARILLGLLTDRFGGRKMFTIISLLSGAAVLCLAWAGSYDSLLAAAFALGIAGASFAVGVPFVNAWFPKRERGLALGIYAMGNAGTAVSGLLTPHLVAASSRRTVFFGMAIALLFVGVSMAMWGHDAPKWRPAKTPALARLRQAFGWKLTWRLALLYAVTFGAFVALGLYLPVLLNQSYGLDSTDAASRAAGFVLLATVVRPIGGWLSDKMNGIIVLRLVFLIIFILAVMAAGNLSLAPVGTIIYLGLAATLGIGNGAIFAVIGHRCDEKLVGAVTGIVGAAGGLGGFFPPLIMGVSYQLFNSYTAALLLLAGVAAVIFTFSRRLLGNSRTY
jgi:NNP family nitrate/nitrite transporter-like MFS transporter